MFTIVSKCRWAQGEGETPRGTQNMCHNHGSFPPPLALSIAVTWSQCQLANANKGNTMTGNPYPGGFYDEQKELTNQGIMSLRHCTTMTMTRTWRPVTNDHKYWMMMSEHRQVMSATTTTHWELDAGLWPTNPLTPSRWQLTHLPQSTNPSPLLDHLGCKEIVVYTYISICWCIR